MTILQTIKNSKLINNDWIFILFLAVFSISYYDGVMEKGPLNTHLWRQADCLSLTYHFYEGNNLLTPEMHIQLGDEDTTGKSAGEFPILYYAVGNIWKMTGVSHLTYRLFYLFILLGGLYCFYKSVLILFGSRFWAFFLSLMLYTSPVYIVYGVSFLTDVPAISFVFVALFFFLKSRVNGDSRSFFIAMAFFALAGLLKVSSLIAFVFLGFIFLLELLPVKSLGNKKLFTHKPYEWLGFGLALVAIFSWYLYAHNYNEIHGFKYTFNDIHPYWLMGPEQVQEVFEKIKLLIIPVLFSLPFLIVLILMAFGNLLLFKKIPLFAYLAHVVVGVGGVMYFMLWAPLMGVHDYYYAALLILFLSIVLPFVWYVKTKHSSTFNNEYIQMALILFLGYNFMYSLNTTKLKTVSMEERAYPGVWNDEFKGMMLWVNWDMKENWYRYYNMRDYIRTIGIQPEDRVICLPDQSFNATLYLLNQKGWTNFLKYKETSEIDYLIEMGAKYLFIGQPEFLEKEFLAPFLTHPIGEFNGVKIFKLN